MAKISIFSKKSVFEVPSVAPKNSDVVSKSEYAPNGRVTHMCVVDGTDIACALRLADTTIGEDTLLKR